MGQFHIEKGVLIKYRGKDKHVVVPDGVREIGRGAFKHCQTMVSISLPAGLVSIGARAFEECKQLTEITLPDGVMIIGASAFEECKSLKKIYIPNSVRVIGAYAFSECRNLQELVIPVGVKLAHELLSLSDIAGEIYCEATKRPHGWEEHWLWDYYPMDDDEESEEDLSDDPYAVWGYNNIITHPDFDYVVHDGKAYRRVDFCR